MKTYTAIVAVLVQNGGMWSYAIEDRVIESAEEESISRMLFRLNLKGRVLHLYEGTPTKIAINCTSDTA